MCRFPPLSGPGGRKRAAHVITRRHPVSLYRFIMTVKRNLFVYPDGNSVSHLVTVTNERSSCRRVSSFNFWEPSQQRGAKRSVVVRLRFNSRCLDHVCLSHLCIFFSSLPPFRRAQHYLKLQPILLLLFVLPDGLTFLSV